MIIVPCGFAWPQNSNVASHPSPAFFLIRIRHCGAQILPSTHRTLMTVIEIETIQYNTIQCSLF